MMHNFATIPEKGCELQDVSGDELAHITRAGGWVVISAYEAKRSRHDGERDGMRYLLAWVDPSAEIGSLRASLDKAQSEKWKVESDLRTARELWATERQELTDRLADARFVARAATERIAELTKQDEVAP